MSQIIRSILIIRYSSMGDVILIAPLIDRISTTFPNAYLVLLTLKPYAEIFKDDTRLSRVIGINKGCQCSDREIIEKQWDVIIDLQNNRRSANQIALLQYQKIFRFNKLHKERNALLFLRIDWYDTCQSVAYRYIRTFNELPDVNKLNFTIPIVGEKSHLFQKKLQPGDIDRPVIALFPFSAWKNKEWGVRRFTQVGQYFITKGWNVVLLGGPNDSERANYIQKKIGKRCISFTGAITLHECGCILQHCNLALGCDTGLSHLARACGVKTGYIFGPTTVHFGFQPSSDPNCIIFEKDFVCRPCHPHGGNFCLRLDRICMRSIKIEEVVAGLMQLYENQSE